MRAAVPRVRTAVARIARRASSWQRGAPPLVAAAARGRLEEVARLLSAGAPIDACNARGQTALHVAARSSRIDAAALLLACGASHAIRDERGRRPLDASNVDPEILHGIRQRYRRAQVRPDDPAASEFGPTGASWLDLLRRDGIVRIPGLVPESMLASLRREFESVVAEIDRGRERGDTIKQGYDEEQHWWPDDLAYVGNNAFRHAPTLTRFFCDARLTALASSYYGRRAFVTRGVAMRYLPLAERRNHMFGWHHDLEDRRIKALVLLTDLPEHGQVMRYLKGSHRLLHSYRMFFRNNVDFEACTRALEKPEVVDSVGRAGDVFFFDSNGIHRGFRRLDAPVRDAFFVEYGVDRSNVWGGDPEVGVIRDATGGGDGPFGELLHAPPKWSRPMTRRFPSWIENLHAVDAWRCPDDGGPSDAMTIAESLGAIGGPG